MKMKRPSKQRCFLAIFAFLFLFVLLNVNAKADEPTTTVQSNTAAASTSATASASNNPAGALQPYVLQVGDEFDVKSYFNPEINEHLIVRPDGHIALPIVGDIVAAGITPQQLSDELTQRYSSEFKQPQVAVIMRTYGNEKVYVAGEVNHPGLIPIVGRITALQAISVAEGFKEESARKSSVIVIRRGPDNRPVATRVNLDDALKGKDITQDVLLQPFDVVYVPATAITNVNRFITQYIKNNIPVNFAFAYRLDNLP